MSLPVDLGCEPMEIKRISVSKKRQITIPQRFFEKLNFGDEVECTLTNSELIIRPVKKETEFAEDILKDLVEAGYSGSELLLEFNKRRAQVRPAIEKILDDAQSAAEKLKGSGEDKFNEIFSDLED